MMIMMMTVRLHAVDMLPCVAVVKRLLPLRRGELSLCEETSISGNNEHIQY